MDGDHIPLGYGIAYARWNAPVFVCYPIPINVVVSLCRRLWFAAMHFGSWRDLSMEVYSVGREAGRREVQQQRYDEGYRAGRRDQVRDALAIIRVVNEETREMRH